MSNLDELLKTVLDLGRGYLPQVAGALLTLVIGFWIIGRIGAVFESRAKRAKVDPTLQHFLGSLVVWTLRALLLVSAASAIGIPMTSFVALLGAAGLAVGLALQGSLSNFAGGVLLLIFRPFKVGDLIEAQGHIGVVREIQIFTTSMLNGQNKRIILPNGPLSNGVIVNFCSEGTLRVDLVVGISYDADVEHAKSVIREILVADSRVLKEPAPTVEVVELADSAVNLVVRPHVKQPDYWAVHFDTLTAVKKRLDEAKIEIPYPQQTVHMKQA